MTASATDTSGFKFNLKLVRVPGHAGRQPCHCGYPAEPWRRGAGMPGSSACGRRAGFRVAAGCGRGSGG